MLALECAVISKQWGDEATEEVERKPIVMDGHTTKIIMVRSVLKKEFAGLPTDADLATVQRHEAFISNRIYKGLTALNQIQAKRLSRRLSDQQAVAIVSDQNKQSG